LNKINSQTNDVLFGKEGVLRQRHLPTESARPERVGSESIHSEIRTTLAAHPNGQEKICYVPLKPIHVSSMPLKIMISLLCYWFIFVSLLFVITVRYMQNHRYIRQFDHTQKARGRHDAVKSSIIHSRSPTHKVTAPRERKEIMRGPCVPDHDLPCSFG
jgi:hypothetical protein